MRFHEVIDALGEPTRRLVDSDGLDEAMWCSDAGAAGVLNEDDGCGWWAVQRGGVFSGHGALVDAAALETIRRP